MEEISVELTPEVCAALDQESSAYVGRWKTLVSQTNWEKGRIIFEWREALITADAPAAEHSDEAWARRVGGVSGQHVGRLRRVFHRFGASNHKFESLSWSHFQAVLDWDDADMWLEGAVQSSWSVSQMRLQRFETVGGPEPLEEVVVSDMDEDFAPLSEEDTPANLTGDYEGIQGPRHDGPDFADEPDGTKGRSEAAAGGESSDAASNAEELVRPFEDLVDLPNDLAEAFDQFKLAIIAHKSNQWEQVSLQDVLRTLDALKALAAAPSSENNAPF